MPAFDDHPLPCTDEEREELRARDASDDDEPDGGLADGGGHDQRLGPDDRGPDRRHDGDDGPCADHLIDESAAD